MRSDLRRGREKLKTVLKEAYDFVEELSEKVGFEVGELSGFPFPVQSVSYYVYWGELAQVEYLGEDGESILYRKSRGGEGIIRVIIIHMQMWSRRKWKGLRSR